MECKKLISAFCRPIAQGKMRPFFRLTPRPEICLRLKNILVFVVSFSMVAFDSMPAYANDPPGSLGEVLFTYMILIAMIMMTLLGGGYAILNRLKAKERPPDKAVSVIGNIVKFVFWFILFFLSIAMANLAFVLCIIFSIYALCRSFMMIKWGVLVARGSEKKPDYLTGVKGARLIYAGSALIMITFVLFPLTLMFASHGMQYGHSGKTMKQEEAVLKRLSSIEMQKLSYLADKRFQKELDALSDQTESELGNIRDAKRRYIVEYKADQKGFTIFLLPADKSMIFTYPSYRADYTAEGNVKIRIIWVRNRDERCPEDAKLIFNSAIFNSQ